MFFTRPSPLQRLFALHPLVLDGGVALSLVVGTWLWDWYGPDMGRPSDLLSSTLTLLANGPLAMRRRAPMAVMTLCAATSLMYHHLGYHIGLNSIALLVTLYTVAVHSSWKAIVASGAMAVAVWTQASALQPSVVLGSALISAVVLAICGLGAGLSTRLLAERTKQLAALAQQLQDEQEAAARRAVTRERVKIARELHDVVAHHMSVISVQAGLGHFVALSDPATAHAALGVISQTSREALHEMRRLLSILRVETTDEDGSLYTAPDLRNLPTLAERMRVAGLPVEIVIEGTVRALPPGLNLCAYRIVQESLTNVLKHAGTVRTKVRVTYAPATLTVRVTNEGGAAVPPGRSRGHGLIGMTERVKLYRGTIITCRLPEGGFEVLATLPLSASDEGE
ncbi:sensor histidine kinase [Nonomuraea phyllanthi]|uniref:histidine kinase n=1 Tax=Nonomuraea phyllanthi TaxID=2219224 RepID=A0A5C4WMY0_9ACTN|nr:histidine kinase [Nonomuraea phyllanthi]KAB8195072.1 sensor histidine kinase [Nonomuraea phyllanthi]QFY10797.1 sensor histidine kinase [Nonomuraea phyllanthi]